MVASARGSLTQRIITEDDEGSGPQHFFLFSKLPSFAGTLDSVTLLTVSDRSWD